jgi:hypothetical protein
MSKILCYFLLDKDMIFISIKQLFLIKKPESFFILIRASYEVYML